MPFWIRMMNLSLLSLSSILIFEKQISIWCEKFHFVAF